MLTKPHLADEKIQACLEAVYGISVSALEFLPVGNDARAWSYRVATRAGKYFLKLRKGPPKPASLRVPHYLRSVGIANVVAPLPTAQRQLCAIIADSDYRLMLYPFVDGESAWDMPLTAAQWRAWGEIMRAIHDCPIDARRLPNMPREALGSNWLLALDEVERVIKRGQYASEVAAAVARIWQAKTRDIDTARRRYINLGLHFDSRSPQFVLCHADIHRANIIIDRQGAIQIVDWDETLLAPKERDLMFFFGNGHAAEAEAAFRAGYGSGALDRVGIAYYRYDWLLQELVDYGQRVFLASDTSDEDLAFARVEFERLFAPGDVQERAQQAFARISSETASA